MNPYLMCLSDIANPNESQFMVVGGIECVASKLVDSKGNVRSIVATEVKQHSNNNSVVEKNQWRWTIVILRKR